MTPRARAVRVLAAGAALIGLAWLLAPSTTPPLYDGLTGPAEAYRYLTPPPGHTQNGPPTEATQTLAVSNGTSAAGYVTTAEQPPQAQFLAGQGGLTSPAGASRITVTVKPVPPPAPLPASLGRLDGNVYEVAASADVPGPVSVAAAGAQPTVVLRAPPNSSGAQIARWVTGGSWEVLHTVPLGGQAPDMYAANTGQLGWFAVVLPASSSSSSSSSGGGGTNGGGGGFPVVAVVVPIAVVVLLAALVVPIRISRTRRR